MKMKHMKIIMATLIIVSAQRGVCATPQAALADFITATEKSDWVTILHAMESAWLIEYGIDLERRETVIAATQQWINKGITKSYTLTGEPKVIELNSYTVWLYPCEIHAAGHNFKEHSTGFISATLHAGTTNWVFLDSTLVGLSEFRYIYSELPTNQIIPEATIIDKQSVQHAPPEGRVEAPRP